MFSDHYGSKLEISNRTESNTFLTNPWLKDDASREIKNYIELSEYESTSYKHLWDTAKTMVIGKFIELMLTIEKRKSLISVISASTSRT